MHDGDNVENEDNGLGVAHNQLQWELDRSARRQAASTCFVPTTRTQHMTWGGVDTG